MATNFNDLLNKILKSGLISNKIKQSRTWYTDAATMAARFIKEGSKTKADVKPGEMYMFVYDPKNKATLPLYDRFPIIFPVGPAPGGFYGLNFHYLDYEQRAKLLTALMGTMDDEKLTASSKIQISYSIIQNVSQMKDYKLCFKHYLRSHVRSPFIYVRPEDWETAIFLPSDDFVYNR